MRCLVSEGDDLEIQNGYTSDLLSDVMGNAPEDSVLITIQAHKNTIAVAFTGWHKLSADLQQPSRSR